MKQIEDNALQLERTIDAPVTKVREALTDPELVAKWFAPGPMSATVHSWDARPGGRYELAMTGPTPEGGEGTHTCAGTFREVTDDRIVMGFNWTEEPLPNDTTLTFELHDEAGSTRLVLRHEGFAGKEAAKMHTEGWEGCLAKLADAF